MSQTTNAGDTLGKKYRLVRRIGAGAIGTVWAAEVLGTGREVALKLGEMPHQGLRHRFMREARILGRLSHPNIVRLLDVGEMDDGDPFLVFELLSGETLRDMLRRRRTVEPGIAARIARDVANALEAIHHAQSIHRDLAPPHVFLHQELGQDGGDFVVKVLGFGHAKSDADEKPQIGQMAVAGSLCGYMSPEQLSMRKNIDARTDLWSLGLVLYEMLAGVRPFRGSVEEVVRQRLTASAPPLSAQAPGVPRELEQIVMQCLERDRDKRIASAAEVAARLSPFIGLRAK